MITPQRRRHWKMWMILAVVLGLILVISFAARNAEASTDMPPMVIEEAS